MTPDPIDQLGARLFEAARNETPPAGAEQRALEALRRMNSEERPTNAHFSARRKWLTASVAVAVAAGSALLLRPRDVSLGISAEPTTVAHREPERRAVSRVEAPSATLNPLPSPPVAPKLVPSAAPTAVHSAPATLSDELSALKVASSALSAGDTQAALAALDRYDRVLKGQKMRAEATLLRIEALSRGGQAAAASRLAQRFVEENPGSPLVDRARSFVQE
ncbi:MAG TPA: hypothetical protein VER04_14215 [Polyangiaceae bacterium]|nr:hypothetical protein [Polyangiaceae bacterium]